VEWQLNKPIFSAEFQINKLIVVAWRRLYAIQQNELSTTGRLQKKNEETTKGDTI